jgi:hypothetical protein
VKAQLLDRVGNIRAGEGDVLESPDQATVGSQIVDAGGGDVRRDLGLEQALQSFMPTRSRISRAY